MASQEKIGALVASLGLDIKEFENALKQAKLSINEIVPAGEEAAKSIEQSFAKAAKKMQSIGKQMTMYVTAPIIGFATGAVKSAMAFEAQMTKMISIIGISRDEVEAWYSSVLDFASVSGVAPLKLAEGLYFATSAGFRGAEAMDIMQQSAKVAAATQGDLIEVVNLATSAMNAYRTSGMTASQALDVIVNSVRLGKVEFDDLVKSMGIVFPVASKLGVSFDQVGAAIAAMTRTGTSAETSAVQLRQILSQLLGPSEQAKKAFKGLQWSAQEFRQEISEKGLYSGLQTFITKIDELGSLEMADAIFGNIRALTGVFDLMGDNVEATEMIFEDMSVSVGRAAKAFEEFQKTGLYKWNQMIATSKALSIEFGLVLQEQIAPVFTAIMNKLIDLIKWWRSLTKEQQINKLVWLGILAAIGPALVILSKLITTIIALRKGFLVLVGAVKTATAAIRANTAASLSNPYLLAAAAIAAVTTAIWGYVRSQKAAKKALEETNAVIEKTKGALLLDAADIGQSIMGWRDIFNITGVDPLANIKEAIKDWNLDELKAVQTELEDRLANTVSGMRNLTEEDGWVFDQFSKNAEDLSYMLSLVSAEIEGVEAALNNMKAEPDNSFARLKNLVAETFSNLENMGAVFKDLDIPAEKLKFIDQQLSDLLMDGVPLDNEKIVYLQKFRKELAALIDMSKGSESDIPSFDDLANTIAEQFRIIEDKGAAFGSSFDVVGEKMKYIQGLFSDLRTKGLMPTSDQLMMLQTHIDALGAGMSGEEAQMASYVQTVRDLEQAYKEIAVESQFLGVEFDTNAAKLEAISSLMQKLKADAEANAVALAYLASEYRKVSKSVAQETIDIGQVLSQSLGSLMIDLVEALATPLEAGETIFERLMGVIADFMGQLGKSLIMTGMAALAFESLLSNPYAAIAAGAALVALSAVTRGLLKRGPNEDTGGGYVAVPAFANGGVVYGPTVGMVGEYPGASSNPEVIAPLSKLKSLLDTTGSSGQVVFEIKGDRLVGVLEKQRRKMTIAGA